MKEVVVRFKAFKSFKAIEFPVFITEEQYQEIQEMNNCNTIEKIKIIDRELPQDMYFDESCSIYDPNTGNYIFKW